MQDKTKSLQFPALYRYPLHFNVCILKNTIIDYPKCKKIWEKIIIPLSPYIQYSCVTEWVTPHCLCLWQLRQTVYSVRHTQRLKKEFSLLRQSVLNEIWVDAEETVQHQACNTTQQQLMATVLQMQLTLSFLEY